MDLTICRECRLNGEQGHRIDVGACDHDTWLCSCLTCPKCAESEIDKARKDEGLAEISRLGQEAEALNALTRSMEESGEYAAYTAAYDTCYGCNGTGWFPPANSPFKVSQHNCPVCVGSGRLTKR